jgi:hypothetical protein
MSIYQYRPGLNNAASYMASGTPFITGSDTLTGTMKIEFPRVTKSITIHEITNNKSIYFYFNENATELNKFIIDTTSHEHQPFTFDVKCKEIYISGSGIQFRLMAELTGIEAKEMFALTGSGVTE